ncbi:MAG: transposase, partial [Planctomycetota bacterium]
MSRPRRNIEIGQPYHIAHRGNHKQTLFTRDEDRAYYLALVHRFSRLTYTQIAAFCLMDNHVHFVAVPECKNSLSQCFGRAHRAYSEFLNRRRGVHGASWEGRFYSAAMDPRHVLNAVRYIERNPVDAGMVSHASEWPWSSAHMHCGSGRRWLLVNADVRAEYVDPREWRRVLGEPLLEEELQQIAWQSLSTTSHTCYSEAARRDATPSPSGAWHVPCTP